ncbi:nuclear transport factor 2 family protein [Haloechinothrix sp. YIM 98757]|uniref:Nuclear transport factor 2 family protein n=1 Tax=Haloechinothrix aidingensis TaxID=2752311 RepID=A0A838AA17_9PSEU|nr:nuclear transport factor 2 family protein [Haloechinothrix aidingensis]MBA0125849.1 nuclear transport factor 2 family protein [Haloechinothrix aidingensis]
MTSESDIQRLAERYGPAWNDRDLDAIMSLHTDDTAFRLHLLDAPDIVGREAVREAFAGLIGAWPDIHFATEQLSYGTGFFVHRYVMSGTLACPMPFGALIAYPTGDGISLTGADVITVVAGKVHRKDTYLDIASAQQQLGLLDGPSNPAQVQG